jgi:hypothetical protein
MPLWLIKALPYIGAVLLVGLAVWYIDHKGYQRAEEKAKLEQAENDKFRLEVKGYINQRVKDVEVGLQSIVSKNDENLHRRLSELDTENKTIVQPTLIREINNDPRFSNPDLGITDGMLKAINQARSSSAGTCASTADGGVSCNLSPSPAAAGQDGGDTRQ